jgi:hypothetical protein
VLIQSRPYNTSHRWSAVADLHTSPVITIDIYSTRTPDFAAWKSNSSPRLVRLFSIFSCDWLLLEMLLVNVVCPVLEYHPLLTQCMNAQTEPARTNTIQPAPTSLKMSHSDSEIDCDDTVVVCKATTGVFVYTRNDVP